MCGLCGSFTQKGTVLSKRDRTQRARVIEGLIIANQVRGTDSAGVAAINYDGKFDILKAAVTPWKFVNRDDTQSLLRTDAPLMIGHTRMTSMGNDVTDENAHPFVEGQVIGAHNGIINNYMQIDRSVRVDSQAVFRLLDNHPDAYDYAFSKVSGSCALTWWDAREPEALFLVAHMNPLAVAVVPRIKTVYWSSVSDHLESIMRTAYGTNVEFFEIKSDTIYRLDANDVYLWQESKVEFGKHAWGDSHYGSQIRVYDHGGYGWETDPEYAAWLRGDELTGGTATDPKVRAAGSTSSLPAPMSTEEEERYERFWLRMMESDSVKSSEDDSEKSSTASTKSVLALTDDEFAQVDRFQVDDLDGSILCDYCDKALGERGAWDNGLQMMLCRWCQNWWDKFGGYVKDGASRAEAEAKEPMGTYPIATT